MRMFLAASESPRWDIWPCRFLSCVICSCAVQLAAFKQVKASLEKAALQLTSRFPGLELLDAVSTVLLDVSAVVTLAVTSTEYLLPSRQRSLVEESRQVGSSVGALLCP